LERPFGEASSRDRRTPWHRLREDDAVGIGVNPRHLPSLGKRPDGGALLYVADSDGRLCAASEELQRLISPESGGALAAQHRDALARLKRGESPVAYHATAVIEGTPREFGAWHARIAGSSGETMFVGVYAEPDPGKATAASKRPGQGADAVASVFEHAKNALFGHVSHELRTPLNAIIGFAELTLLQTHGRLDGHYLSYLSDIRSAAAQLLQVVDNLLEAAAQDVDDSWRASSLPLSEVVIGAKAAVAPLAAARGIDLSAVAVAEDCVIPSGADRLRHILRQLLSNAVKFTRPQGQVGVDVAHPRDDTVEVTVWDNGAGIAPEILAGLFEDFGTLSQDVMTQPCDGLGLGLANARRLARQMGGDIRVESEEGRGSRFTVTLPAGTGERAAPS
jgi:signal transduction histidine kinase